MIKKLREKFILINMALVSLVLLIVLFMVIVSLVRGMDMRQQMALSDALNRKPGMDSLQNRFEEEALRGRGEFNLSFAVTCGEEGEILRQTEGIGIFLSQEELEAAVSEAFSAGAERGTALEGTLRYSKIRLGGEVRIAFLNVEADTAELKSQILSLGAAGLLGLLAFFFVSLFLSAWALRPVEKAWEQQRQFVADASHELKTPLTVILANTGLLLANREDKIQDQLKWVENTETEGLYMKGLIEDLLFLARSDAAEEKPRQDRVNLSDTVLSALLPFEAVAFEKGLRLKNEIAPDVYVTGDGGKLREMFGILLDNACKYGKEQVVVRLKKAQDRAVAEVENLGETLKKEELQRIFERFYRADPARGQGGYGLGLAIAKSIAGAHGASISAMSAGGKTVFTVVMKCA